MQVLQARYQRERHYARLAMGAAGPMDVSSTETVTEFHSGLYVIVFFVIVAREFHPGLCALRLGCA